MCKANRASLFSVVPMDRPRSSGHRLFSLNIRKCTFSVRMTKHWQLPREVVECPFLEEFRCCLGAVQHLALGSPAGAGELDQMSYRGLFQLQGFCDAVKGAHLKNPCLQWISVSNSTEEIIILLGKQWRVFLSHDRNYLILKLKYASENVFHFRCYISVW